MIDQLMSSLVAGGGGQGGSGAPGNNAGIGSLSIPMSSTATSSAVSRAGSRYKRVNVNFGGKTSDYEEYEPGGGYFRSRAPINYTNIALIAAAAIVVVYAATR